MTICLVGFMGSGKTTIGRLLSEVLGRSWIDLDSFIEQQEGIAISTIFANKGESYFRTLETQALKQLIKKDIGVLSTGGGIIEQLENREVLKETYTIYLSYPFDVLYRRIEGDTNRPLATSYEVLSKRYEKRLAWYNEVCRKEVLGEGKTTYQVVTEITHILDKEGLL